MASSQREEKSSLLVDIFATALEQVDLSLFETKHIIVGHRLSCFSWRLPSSHGLPACRVQHSHSHFAATGSVASPAVNAMDSLISLHSKFIMPFTNPLPSLSVTEMEKLNQ